MSPIKDAGILHGRLTGGIGPFEAGLGRRPNMANQTSRFTNRGCEPVEYSVLAASVTARDVEESVSTPSSTVTGCLSKPEVLSALLDEPGGTRGGAFGSLPFLAASTSHELLQT